MSWMFLLFGGFGLLQNVEKPSSNAFIGCAIMFGLGLITAALARVLERNED